MTRDLNFQKLNGYLKRIYIKINNLHCSKFSKFSADFWLVTFLETDWYHRFGVSEPRQTSKMERFAEVDNYFCKMVYLDFWLGCESLNLWNEPAAARFIDQKSVA